MSQHTQPRTERPIKASPRRSCDFSERRSRFSRAVRLAHHAAAGSRRSCTFAHDKPASPSSRFQRPRSQLKFTPKFGGTMSESVRHLFGRWSVDERAEMLTRDDGSSVRFTGFADNREDLQLVNCFDRRWMLFEA